MVQLVSESFAREYKAQSICSTGCLVCICFYLTIILLPFILAMATDGLWLEFKEKSVEPIISYKNEFILQVLSDQDNAYFSTLTNQQKINTINPSALTISVYFFDKQFFKKTYTIDYNKNKKPELIHLHFGLNKKFNSEIIKGFYLMIFFDYKFKGDINMKTKSLVSLHAEASDGIGKVYLTGNIEFSQRALLIQGSVPDEKYNESIFDQIEENSEDMMYVLEQYHQRNFTTYADYSKLIFPDQNQNEVEIFVDLNIPAIETIDYSPPLIEKVKFAWIQYFSLFLPIYYILGTILAFIYKEQIATNIEKNNIQNEF